MAVVSEGERGWRGRGWGLGAVSVWSEAGAVPMGERAV